MRIIYRFFSISLIAASALVAGAPVFAQDPQPASSARESNVQKMTQSDASVSTDLGLVPDGLMRDVMNLMTGIRKPIDDSASVTFQAGTGFRVGLTF